MESFRKDPAFAAKYLNAVLEDGNQEELMVALRQIAHSFGGVAELVERTKLNATTLYRTLSTQGNRELRGMAALLKATDIRPAVQPIRKAAR